MKCALCRFYFKQIDLANPGVGQCHRRSPKVVPMMGAQGMQLLGVFPPVKDEDFCGEFEAKLSLAS